MATFSVSYVTGGQVITASVFNNLISQIGNLNTLSSTNFPATVPIVANINLKAPNATYTVQLMKESIPAGATHGVTDTIQARVGLFPGASATLVGAAYSITSIADGTSVAKALLWVNNSTALNTSVSFGKGATAGTPVFSTVQSAGFLKTTFDAGDTVELKNQTTGGFIRGINVCLFFKLPHRA